MSEQEVSKYRLVVGTTFDLADKMNALVEEGYRFIENLGEVQVLGRDQYEHGFAVIMGLRSTPDLQTLGNFENADIGSTYQRELESKGYVAIANYSKHMTWAKPKVK